MKRCVDLLFAGAAFVLFALPLLVLAILIRVHLGRPVLFRQFRPGLGGRPFELVKFRTMTDTRGSDGELLSDGQRLTSLGRFMRSTSLDELPELWNVLRGEMLCLGTFGVEDTLKITDAFGQHVVDNHVVKLFDSFDFFAGSSQTLLDFLL